jgi:hydroxyacylglutathione hydrolase
MTPKIHTLSLRMSLAYLIEGPEGIILVDAGLRGEGRLVLKKMKELGREDLRLIFITHAHLDHYGSAAELRRITGAPIAVHHQDEEAMALGETRLGSARSMGRALEPLVALVYPLLHPEPAEADLIVEDGFHLGRYGIDAKVLHTPGHTDGSCCLVVQDRLAFAGDLITYRGGPRLQRYFAQDWSALPTSLVRLQAIQPDWVYPGHGRQPIKAEELQSI